MVILTTAVGQKCAVMLPGNFLNVQTTPSTGILISRTLNREAVVLVEEVWQFCGLDTGELLEKITLAGVIRENSWGWVEVPNITNKTVVIKVKPNLVKEAKPHILEDMIYKSVADFKRINRI